MTTLNKDKILQDLKNDYVSARDAQSAVFSKIKKWRSIYNGEPYGNEDKAKKRSSIVSRDIKKQSEWQHAELIEPFVSTPNIINASPVSYEDVAIAPKIELLLNTQFCRQFNRYNFMSQALKVLDVDGTCVVRTGWEFEEKEVKERILEEHPNPQYEQAMMIFQQAQMGGVDEGMLSSLQEQISQIPPTIQVPKIVKQVKPVKNHPTAMVCRNEDVFIDPTCLGDMDKCNFIVHRYETDLSTLKKEGIYFNLKILENSENMDVKTDSYYYTGYDDSFSFKDKSRQKLLIYEYWGYYDINGDGINEPIVAAWINDVLIRLEDNPYPDKKLPFIVTPFIPIPFKIHGESNAELLDDIQKIKTAIYRGFIDNMALSNNGQKGIRKGSLDAVNLKKFLAGENFQFNTSPNDFYDGHFNELPGSAFNMLQLLSNEAESITGIKSFNQGLNSNSLGGTATTAKGVLSSAATRRTNIVRNIAENLVKPLLRKWLAYDAEFLDEENQIRITNDEFIWLQRDDLGANIDIELNISTSDDNQAKASELAFILQTTAQSLPFELTKTILVKLANLYRLPDLAKAIETYEQPQPDPMQEQMQQLQLQAMQAEVGLTESKAQKNMAEIPLKEAKTNTEMAKAENISSKTDKQDLDYLHSYNQTAEKNKIAEQNRKHQFDIDRETLKLLQGAKPPAL